MDWIELLKMIFELDRQLDAAIAHLGPAIYLLLFVVVFGEIAFIPLFFLPGDPLLFICGALCATGALSIWILTPLFFCACVSGSMVSYRIGAPSETAFRAPITDGSTVTRSSERTDFMNVVAQ